MGVAKDRNRQVPSRTLDLSCRVKGLDQEPRHVSPKPNPEPCDGHNGHNLNDASAELAPEGLALKACPCVRRLCNGGSPRGALIRLPRVFLAVRPCPPRIAPGEWPNGIHCPH